MPQLVNIPKTNNSARAHFRNQTFLHLTLPHLEICVVCGLWSDLFIFVCLFIPALSDSKSNSLLNGNFVVAMFKREITFKGTVIEYSGSDTKVERINCTDRIEEELVLQVLEDSFSSLFLITLSIKFLLYLFCVFLCFIFSHHISPC